LPAVPSGRALLNLTLEAVLLPLGAFLAAFAGGLSGFADIMIASGIWLQVLDPAASVPLVMVTGTLIHLLTLRRLSGGVRWRLLWPALAGAAVAAPLGVLLFDLAEPGTLKRAIGVAIVAVSLYGLLSPRPPVIATGARWPDMLGGAVGGVVGGATGLTGAVIALWCQTRPWDRDSQRGVYQPFIIALNLVVLAIMFWRGSVNLDAFAWLPWLLAPVVAGVWLGFALYRRIDERAFRRLVLCLLLGAGVLLVI
jgi:uncharacterized membrane protein YfcA